MTITVVAKKNLIRDTMEAFNAILNNLNILQLLSEYSCLVTV